MKKLLFLLALVPAIASAQRFGSIRTGDDVSLSSNTILNQNTLQTGATFYVSSGTVNGKFIVSSTGSISRLDIFSQSPAAFGPNFVAPIIFAQSKTDSGGFGGNSLEIAVSTMNTYENAGAVRKTSLFLQPPGGGASSGSGFITTSINGVAAFQATTDYFATDTGKIRLNDLSTGNWLVLQSSVGLTGSVYYVFESSNATTPGYALTSKGVTGGKVNIGFGLAAPIGYGSQYSIQVADGSGGTATSGWVVNPSIIGLTDVAFGPNFFATQNAGVGLGGVFVIYSPSLANKVSFGSPDSGWSEDYRFDFPASRLTTNQVWTTTTSAHPGNRVQLVNTPVIISTSGLQTGATFYVSSGTVNNLNIGSGGIKYPDGTVQISSPTPNPAKDYWWVGSGTLPLEPKGDSVAAVNITTGTNVDVLSADYDSSAEECRGVNFVVPSEVDTSTDVLISPYWMSVSTNSGSVVWKFYHNNGITTGSSFNQVGQAYSFSATSVASSTGTITVSQFSLAVSSLTWSASEMVDGRICRDAGNASDTMTGDAKLNGLRIRIPMR